MLSVEYVGNNPASQKFSILSGPTFKTVPREKTEYTMAKDVEKEENCLLRSLIKRLLSQGFFSLKNIIFDFFQVVSKPNESISMYQTKSAKPNLFLYD